MPNCLHLSQILRSLKGEVPLSLRGAALPRNSTDHSVLCHFRLLRGVWSSEVFGALNHVASVPAAPSGRFARNEGRDGGAVCHQARDFMALAGGYVIEAANQVLGLLTEPLCRGQGHGGAVYLPVGDIVAERVEFSETGELTSQLPGDATLVQIIPG